MKQKISQQMGGDLTAKHFCASVKLLYAAGKTDFYLRQNELVAIAIPEVDDKWNRENAVVFFVSVKERWTNKIPWRWVTNEKTR